MIKVYINNEEVLCDKNIVIKKEMLNTSSTILNNVYPKSWETTHDYTTNYYYPLDYSNCKIIDERDIPAEEGQTIEGTTFEINADLTKEYSFDSFKGDTTQNGTPTPSNPVNVNVVTGGQDIVVCGKNLLYSNLTYPFTTNGVTVTQESDGSVTLNGTQTNSFHVIYNNSFYNDIKNYEGKTISISLTTSGTGSFSNCGIKRGTSPDLFITTYPTLSKTGVLNLQGYTDITFDIWFNNSGRTFVNYNIKPQVEVGNVTEYEKYNGTTFEITLGKNLLQNNLTSGTKNGITYVVNEDKSVTLNGTATAITWLILNSSVTLEAGTYTMTSGYSGNDVRVYSTGLGKYTLDGQRIVTKTSSVSGDVSINIPSGTICNNLTIKPMIEKGSSASSYAEYKTPIELCKIGDYQDRIYKNNGKWYLHKEIGKAVLDGSEDWAIWKTNTFYSYFNEAMANEMCYCSHFVKVNQNQTLTNGIAFVSAGGGVQINIYPKQDFIDNYGTLAGFKNWLASNNPIVYYILATPTTTEITDTELINQLESIELIEGINNISSNGNLPIIMNLHYNYVKHRIDTTLLFSGIVKNTGNISLNPREPHYSSIEVLGYETFLSEGETLDFVIYEKTIEEAIDLVINTISDYGIIKGNINIKNPNDIIGAYSTKDKTAYDVFNYIADITQSRWTTRIIDENTIAIDFYDPDLMTNGIDLDFTQEFFANNNIIDMQYNYGTRDYRNKQVMNSNAVYSNIETNETIIADGYQTQFNTTDKIGNITKITLNGSEVIVKTKDEYELGYTCDFYYTPGNNYFESVDLVSTGAVLVIDYYAIIQGREILLNNTEINRVSSMTGRKGVISRYEDRNDATSTTELSQIGQSYLRYKGAPEIILTIESLNDIWNIGEKVEFNNAPLNELATEYMVKKKTIHYIPTVDNIFYDFELTSNFNSENAINYFDNQRSKNKGNIGQGETISRNIDISNTANVIFYDVDIQEVSVEDDNILNSTLNSPLVQ